MLYYDIDTFMYPIAQKITLQWSSQEIGDLSINEKYNLSVLLHHIKLNLFYFDQNFLDSCIQTPYIFDILKFTDFLFLRIN